MAVKLLKARYTNRSKDLWDSAAANSIQQTMQSTMFAGSSKVATIIGFSSLIIGATAVFNEIQDSINLIWKLKSKPKKGRGWFAINN
jgi:membrane protein